MRIYMNLSAKRRFNSAERRLEVFLIVQILLFSALFVPLSSISSGHDIPQGMPESGLSNSSWPIFHGNIRHTGQSPYDTHLNAGVLKWSFETGSDVWSSPTIDSRGNIYFQSHDGYLYCLYPNGTEIWRFFTGDDKISSPTIGFDGTVYVGSSNHIFYAIYPNGTLKWSFETGDEIWATAAIGQDGTIYIGSYDDSLYALYPNGTLKWKFKTGGNIFSCPALGQNGTIYFSSFDHYIYALYPNGTLKWRFETGGGSYSSPSIDDNGTVYVGSEDDYFYALYPNGTLKWKFHTGNYVRCTAGIAQDGTIYIGSYDRHMYALYPNGTEKWSFLCGDISFSSPAIGSDGMVYFGSADHHLYAFYPNGTEKWSFEAEDYVCSSPAIASDGTIYVGSDDHHLYAFGPDTKPPSVVRYGPSGDVESRKPGIYASLTDDTRLNTSSVKLYVGGVEVNTSITLQNGVYNVTYTPNSPLEEGRNITCSILAEDIYGNSMNCSWGFTVLYERNRSLHPGWNLITLRWDDKPISITDVLSGNWSRAMIYVNGTWHTYDRNMERKFNIDFVPVNSTEGIWLYIPQKENLTFYYLDTPNSTRVHLHRGWNLVGYPSLNDSKVSDALSGVPWEELETSDATGKLYHLGPSDYLIAGKAYWIYVTDDCIWTVDS